MQKRVFLALECAHNIYEWATTTTSRSASEKKNIEKKKQRKPRIERVKKKIKKHIVKHTTKKFKMSDAYIFYFLFLSVSILHDERRKSVE